MKDGSSSDSSAQGNTESCNKDLNTSRGILKIVGIETASPRPSPLSFKIRCRKQYGE